MEAGPGVMSHPDAGVLYSQYFSLLHRVATRKYRVPPTDAEPLIHEVFVSYLLVQRPLADVERWLIGGICNQSRNYWRARLKDALPPEFSADPRDVEFEDAIVRELLVARILHSLDERCRGLLRRHYFEEQTARELAAGLRTSVGYAQRLIHKCLVRARLRYEKQSTRNP